MISRLSLPPLTALLALFTLGSVQPGAAQVGLLVVAHGADSGWNARVEQSVREVRWESGPARLAYLMGPGAQTASWDRATRELVAAGAKSIVVVPLMVSSRGEHVTQIRFYAGEVATLPTELQSMVGHGQHAVSPPPVPMEVTSALDAAPELGAILLSRWRGLAEADRRRPLLLIAHGPSADSLAPHWIEALTAATRPLATEMNAPVHIGLLRDDAEPAVRAAAIRGIRDSITALALTSGDSVTTMTVLVSSGTINTITVPKDLAGMPIRYFGISLAPHPELARWIERVAASRVRLNAQE